MSDFQSRMNTFRQGLNDQQDAYNKMASNLSNLGRTVLPDKLAQHYDYMEKTGGMITGVSAMVHGGKKIGSRLMKYRQARQAKANNTPTDSPMKTKTKQVQQESDDATAQRDTERTTDDTTVEREPNNPAELNEVGEQGRRAKEVAGEDDDDEETGIKRFDADERVPETDERGEAPLEAEDAPDLARTGANMASEARQGLTEGIPKDTPVSDEGLEGANELQGKLGDLLERIRGATGEGGGASARGPEPEPEPESEAPTGGDTRTVLQRQDDLEEGASKFAGQTAAKDTEADFTDMVSSGIKDTVVSGVKRGIGKLVGEGVGEALGDAIPFVGEAIGLGTLIAGIAKAHKHEENSPGPKLSKALPEPTEQAGGFSAQMLKTGVGAPGIV